MVRHFLLLIATIVLPGLNALTAQDTKVHPKLSIDYLDDEAALKQAAFERQQLRMAIPLSPEQAKYDAKSPRLRRTGIRNYNGERGTTIQPGW